MSLKIQRHIGSKNVQLIWTIIINVKMYFFLFQTQKIQLVSLVVSKKYHIMPLPFIGIHLKVQQK